MKFENNDDEDFMKNSRPLDPEDDGEIVDLEEDLDLPEDFFTHTIFSEMSSTTRFPEERPFGMVWSPEMIKRFLTRKGYEYITREDFEGDVVEMVYKPGCELLPNYNNVNDVFHEELQASIIDLLTGKMK